MSSLRLTPSRPAARSSSRTRSSSSWTITCFLATTGTLSYESSNGSSPRSRRIQARGSDTAANPTAQVEFGSMAEVATRSRFTKQALADLPPAGPFVSKLREEALAEFEAAPIPSQETEEWRYTDLSEFDFDFTPFVPGGPWADSLDGVPEEIQAAAGDIGDRAGLQIQRNSEVILSREGPDADRDAVHFESLDHAIRDHPELVEPYLHAIVPSDRTKFTALHAAFRTGGTFVYVPPGVTVELPLQALTYLEAEGAAVFPHTLLVVGDDAEVTFIDRYVSPDLNRGFSDAVVEIHAGNASRVRYVSLQDWGSGVTHLSVQRAVLGRDAELRSLSVQFGGDRARS